MKELKVGERVTITLEVVEEDKCEGCYFCRIDNHCDATLLKMKCVAKERSDGKNVIFKEIKE